MSLVLIVQLIPPIEAASVSFEDYIISQIESCATTIDVTQYILDNDWDKDEVMEEYQQIIADNPQLFYVSGAVSFSGTISSSTGKINKGALSKLGYIGTKSEIADMVKKFNAAAKKALAEIDKDMTEAEKALAIHDYLIVNCAYDTSLKNYDAYDCLVSKKAVCQGYSLAYKYLLNQVGVTCEMISSESMNHAWNYVKIGSKWYHVDVTMDDPLFANGKRDFFGNVSHEFFLLSDNAIKKASTPHKGWELNGLPKANSTKYNNYFWRDVNSAIVKSGKYWYYLKLNPKSPGMNYSTSKSTEMQTYLYRYSFSSNKSWKIYTLKSTWTKWGNKNSWYLNSYARMAEYEGKIYFNSYNKIYCYNVSTNKITTFLKPSTSSGYIYGLAVIDGKLTYSIKTSPTAKDVLKTKTL